MLADDDPEVDAERDRRTQVAANREAKKHEAEEAMDDTDPLVSKKGEKWKELHMSIAANRTDLSCFLWSFNRTSFYGLIRCQFLSTCIFYSLCFLMDRQVYSVLCQGNMTWPIKVPPELRSNDWFQTLPLREQEAHPL